MIQQHVKPFTADGSTIAQNVDASLLKLLLHQPDRASSEPGNGGRLNIDKRHPRQSSCCLQSCGYAERHFDTGSASADDGNANLR